MFDPGISLDCYYVRVDAEIYDHVELRFADGTSVSFAGEFSGVTEFGFSGDGRLPPGSDGTVDVFHGPIQEVTVRAWDLSETVRREGPCVFDDLVFDCDSARHRRPGDVRVRFVDGSVKQWDPPADGQVWFGSPGRVIESITEERVDVEVRNPDTECEPGEYATVFDCTEVTITAAEFAAKFAAEPTFDRVELRFVDGSTQAFGDRAGGPNFTAPETFAGSGDHAGKIIESVVVTSGGGDRSFLLVNPTVADCDPASSERGATDGA